MTAAHADELHPSSTPEGNGGTPAAATRPVVEDFATRPGGAGVGHVVGETVVEAAGEVLEPRPRPRRRHHGVTRPAPPAPVSTGAGDLVQQTAMAVRGLTVAVNRFRDAVADALEISPTDVLALTEVSLAPALTPGELADRIGVGVAGTSTVIDKLVRAGFLRRTPSTLDRRTYTLGLTPSGTHAVGWIWDATRAAIADATPATAADTVSTSPAESTPSPTPNPPQDPPQPATVTALNALAAAYYHHADSLGSG